jgi:DNA-binding transcriptional ArsR family regulator
MLVPDHPRFLGQAPEPLGVIPAGLGGNATFLAVAVRGRRRHRIARHRSSVAVRLRRGCSECDTRLSDPTRRRVLQLLRKRPMTAGEIADHFDVSRPTMSAHFAVLREAHLIDDATKKGTTITYRIRMSVLEEALLGFAGALGLDVKPAPKRAVPRRKVTKEA